MAHPAADFGHPLQVSRNRDDGSSVCDLDRCPSWSEGVQCPRVTTADLGRLRKTVIHGLAAYTSRVPRKGPQGMDGLSCKGSCKTLGLTGSSRCGCSKLLRACGAVSWLARRELLDLDAGTLSIEVTRVVVDGPSQDMA
jgi:hypothetical protein